jgi:hypothetical protein
MSLLIKRGRKCRERKKGEEERENTSIVED